MEDAAASAAPESVGMISDVRFESQSFIDMTSIEGCE
jgi:hypothetical protein